MFSVPEFGGNSTYLSDESFSLKMLMRSDGDQGERFLFPSPMRLGHSLVTIC
jgi:hypothetical protein